MIRRALWRLLLEQGGWSRIWYGLATAMVMAGGGLIYNHVTGGGGGACALPAYPDATCTGYPSNQSFTTSGGVTISTNNATYDGYHFTGGILVDATGVTIKNSWIDTTGDGIEVNAGATVTVEDTEIDCGDTATDKKGVRLNWDTPNDPNTAILTRLNIHGCQDGIYASQDFTLQDSYIHNLDNGGADPHNDGIQIDNAKHYKILHNAIYGVDTSAINNCNATNTNCQGIHDVLIQNNLLSGGAYTLYCPIPATTNFVIQGNHWINNSWAFGSNTDCSAEIDGGGNVIHETGAPVSLDTG